MRRSRSRPLALALAALAAAAPACFSERPTSPGDDTPDRSAGTCRVPVASSAVGSPQLLIAIESFRFQPDTVRVARGATVTWVNCEPDDQTEAHTATADAGEWRSGDLAPRALFSRRFDTPGTFSYHCDPHPFMRGTVVVE